MKKSVKSMLGVTLLEIMLVLAIAAMIIVMSVRYYQSASQSQQANAFVSQVQAITAAVENLALGTGDYTSVTQGDIEKILPGGSASMIAPWGGDISFQSGTNGFTLTVPQPATGVCTLLKPKLSPPTAGGGTPSKVYTVNDSCTSVVYSTLAN